MANKESLMNTQSSTATLLSAAVIAAAPADGVGADRSTVMQPPAVAKSASEPASHSQRYQRGLEQLRAVDGDAGVRVVEQLAQAFPDFAEYVVEYPFGDIYARPGLGLRERELAVVAALTAMGNAAPQLRVHVHAALHVGCKPEEIVEAVMQMSVYAGFPAALNGLSVVREVFRERDIALPLKPSGGVNKP
jgi:4-carboxymuconolactone decarboxylase